MSIIPTTKKDLSKLITLEKEREAKRIQGETEELIEEMGQESDRKAVKVVQEYVKEQQEQERKEHQQNLEMLSQLAKNRQQYQRYLIAILHAFVKEEGIPRKYTLFAESTDVGIVLGIQGTEYIGAFRTSGMPKFDINACKILAVKLGNTVARLDGNFRETEGGILVANKEEFKLVEKTLGRKLLGGKHG